MPLRARTFQTNFAAGQMDPRMLGREDIGIFANSASNVVNSAPLVQGGVRRRPGTQYLAAETAHTRLERFRFSSTQLYIFAFSNTELKIFNASGTLLQTLSSQPWSATTMWEMRMTTSGDTTIITHPDFIMKKLLRTGASTFTISDFVFEAHSSGYPRYQPYYKFAADTITLDPSATSGSVTLTTSDDHWTSSHVGSVVRYKGKEIDVTGYTSATVVSGTVRETLSAHTADADWDENVFSAANGYARSVTFHPRRLWFGGSRDLPNFMWSSKSNAFFNFDVGTGLDDESIQGGLGQDEVNNIMHLHSGRHLQIFTDSAVLYLRESDSKPITPSDYVPRFTVPYGSSDVVPVRFDGATIFVQDTGKVVRELLWNDLQDAYTANPISLVSNDIISDVQQMTVFYGTTTGPEQWALIVNGDGTLALYHSVRSEKIAAWFPWSTTGNFESVTELNGIVYTSVKRTVPNQATCTITVTDYSNIATNATIVLTDNAGTATTFTCQGSGTGTPETNKFFHHASNDTTADNIYTTINTHSSYTVPNPAANVITVTRNTAGLSNLTVTTSDSTRLAVTDFVGADVYHLEKFDFDKTVDSSATLSSVSGNTWGGLSHLLSGGYGFNSEVVDGNLYHGNYSVNSSGQVVLDETATAPIGGLDFTRTIKDMPVVISGPSGSTSGDMKRVGQVVLRVYDSVNFSVSGQEFLIRQVDDDLQADPTPVDGQHVFYLNGWTRTGQITITQTAPLPFTLLSIWKEVLT